MEQKADLPLSEYDYVSDDDSQFHEPPPTYDSICSDIALEPQKLTDEKASLTSVEENGRFSINLSAGPRTSAIIQELYRPTQLPRLVNVTSTDSPQHSETEDIESAKETKFISLDIVLMLVGSRDEIRSCAIIGQKLRQHGHRVRVVTHSIFKTLITKLGLEFFSFSGSPEHPVAKQDSGLMPELRSSKRQEVLKSSKLLLETLKGCWTACTHPGWWKDRPFLADAIIATRLAHAHLHCAERLDIPLHIMSTSPWTPTRRFAHPLAYFRASTEVEQEVQNYLSYTLIEESIWQECYHVVDHFRRAILGLPGLPLNGGGGVLRNLNVPHTYLWTSALVPAPNDWERTINIGGYIPTTTQALPYNPPNELTQFLESTPAPIFVSLDISLLQSPERFVRCVKEASEKYGLAFLLPSTFHSVSGISEDSKLFVLHDVPIEWLIPKVSVLFNHGDSYTISVGLRHGIPMISVPLLRDQPFWSTAIFKAGLGPPPVHEKDFSCESLVMAIRQCLQPEVRENARAIANKMKTEDGVARTVRLFHRYMNWDAMQCSFSQEDVATFRICDNPSVQLSSVAAVILLNAKGLRWSELELIKRHSYSTDEKPEGSISKCDTSRSATSMSVGKDLIKAIAKPTFSHIADACNGIESTNQTRSNMERSKTNVAVDVAKNVGFGSAVFLGKVAMLPFKTVYYMGGTASYGVKSLQSSNTRQHATGNHSQQWETSSYGAESTATSRPSSRRTNSDDSINRQQIEVITKLQIERGRRDRRLQDPEFVNLVITSFEALHKSASV